MTLVVVDDGSTDDTGARLDAWAAARPPAARAAPGARRGGRQVGALNDALGACDAEIAVVFDADHEPDPTPCAGSFATSATRRSAR